MRLEWPIYCTYYHLGRYATTSQEAGDNCGLLQTADTLWVEDASVADGRTNTVKRIWGCNSKSKFPVSNKTIQPGKATDYQYGVKHQKAD
jgi:hypothetical protein